jgi:coenzyme F420-0:L-glutamate ligase / coenzyme F420-1:gamma-L-glutamate ligase
LTEIRLIGIEGIPEIKTGDPLVRQTVDAADRNGIRMESGDILVIAQKIVSKAEGRLVCLDQVTPSEFAQSIARTRSMDARMAELILRESRRIVRMNERVIITETHHGLICANAGIDQSNVPGEGIVTLLPENPDFSAAKLRADVTAETGIETGIIISDTFGRPWREGLTNVAIGIAGINPLRDFRNEKDDFGRLLRATVLATADELATAGGLIMRKTNRLPVVLIRGFHFEPGEHSMKEMLRAREQDLFR